MKFKFFFIIAVLTILSCGCQFFESKKEQKLPENWEMIDMFEDQIDEIQTGGYYSLFRNEPKPVSDSIPPDEEVHDIVAIAIQDELIENKSKAVIWIADSKQELVLQSNETEKDKKYHRVYANDLFTVDLNMNFSHRIDGLDEADMMIYSGKMKVSQNNTSKSIEFKVKGGI